MLLRKALAAGINSALSGYLLTSALSGGLSSQALYFRSLEFMQHASSVPASLRTKSRRSFFHDIECSFERDADLAQQSIVEQSSEDSDAVRHAARWIELRQRVRRIGRPVAARFRNFDKARAHGQRRMAGEVGDS